MEFNSQIDQKKGKARRDNQKACNQVEENLEWKSLFSYFFQIYESYEIKFPTDIFSL